MLNTKRSNQELEHNLKSKDFMQLKHVAKFKIDFPKADFWLIRSHSFDVVGKPMRDYTPDRIGVKVTRTDILVPDYLFYVFQYFYNEGYFQALAVGTLNLTHIKVKDLEKIYIKPR